MEYLRQGKMTVKAEQGRSEQIKYWVYENCGYYFATVQAHYTQEVSRQFDASEVTLQQVMYWIEHKAYNEIDCDDSCYGYDTDRDMQLCDANRF